MSRIALVTDSTASLPPEVAEAHGIVVVPLQVVIGGRSYDEGVEGGATPQTVAAALREWTPVSTSRPTPAAMLEVYEHLHNPLEVTLHIRGRQVPFVAYVAMDPAEGEVRAHAALEHPPRVHGHVLVGHENGADLVFGQRTHRAPKISRWLVHGLRLVVPTHR